MDNPASVEKTKSDRRQSGPVKHVVPVPPKSRVENKKPWNVSTKCPSKSNEKFPQVPNNTSLLEGMAAQSPNPTTPIINGGARPKSKYTTNKTSLTKPQDVASSTGERAGPGSYGQLTPVTHTPSSQGRVNESLRAEMRRLSTSVSEDINSLKSNIEDLTRNVGDVLVNQHILYGILHGTTPTLSRGSSTCTPEKATAQRPPRPPSQGYSHFQLGNRSTPTLSRGSSTCTPEKATAQRSPRPPSQGYRRTCTTRITCGTCGACGTCGTNLDTQHREALEPIDQNDTNGVVISEHVEAPDANNDNNAEDHTAHANSAIVVTDANGAGIATDGSSANHATVNSASSNAAAVSAPDSATGNSATGNSVTGNSATGNSATGNSATGNSATGTGGEPFFKNMYNERYG